MYWSGRKFEVLCASEALEILSYEREKMTFLGFVMLHSSTIPHSFCEYKFSVHPVMFLVILFRIKMMMFKGHNHNIPTSMIEHFISFGILIYSVIAMSVIHINEYQLRILNI